MGKTPKAEPAPLTRLTGAPVRVVTAGSLFDGHDASINVMRRVMLSAGAEVIHLGHNRSAREVVDCAVQEDSHGIAVTSYQGGHMEYFEYMLELLRERGCGRVRVFGGGGGVILPAEIKKLHAAGVARIYSPDDGRAMGLDGMIADLLRACGVVERGVRKGDLGRVFKKDFAAIARLITAAEEDPQKGRRTVAGLPARAAPAPVLGVTGTGGSGKSSLIDELLRRFLRDLPERSVAVVAADPSKRKTGGALLGDRIRMNAIDSPRVYMRSMAVREPGWGLPSCIDAVLGILKVAGFDLIVLETPGIGQSDTAIVGHCDLSLYVMTPEFGAPTQLEKIGMLDYADLVVINKFDKRGADDALRAVRKQYAFNRRGDVAAAERSVFGARASQYGDPGVDRVYRALLGLLAPKAGWEIESSAATSAGAQEHAVIIPNNRAGYLCEISQTVRGYNQRAEEQSGVARRVQALREAAGVLSGDGKEAAVQDLRAACKELEAGLDPGNLERLEGWQMKAAAYRAEEFVYEVRGARVKVKTGTQSLSGLRIPKVALPPYKDWGDLLHWMLKENLPGEFPYAAGVFPFRREGEDPTRMFAGEGGPERTNRRFHYLSEGMPAARLSTAFDAVTLYGADPDLRPDIYGKIGNSGVSICCLDDAKKLYSGFNLADPATSVSMTINGPAPVMTAFFMNAAIDQQCERQIKAEGREKEVRDRIARFYREKGVRLPVYQGRLPDGHDGLGLLLLGSTGEEHLSREQYQRIKADTISKVRGTVQADILKEDQAQNTCIYAIDFALKLMGDVAEYFIRNKVRNFYSVSISGYHIAEAGANPITQLALTLANGFTYVEHYLSRGMAIDEFAPNLSFFFSSSMDPEASVIGRVARLIWAKAMKLRYGANPQSQRLKYHCQTSGRSLHSQEIGFNDIRTTLQALTASYDNCNSLHTNAYDEAITTPTEESVRRALAIQLVINREFGVSKNQNPLQGSFVISELTDLVEEAVLAEFERLSARGGVLGAMETAYQRGKIQDESLHYETLKHTGQLPIMGVNTFLSPCGSPTVSPKSVTRASGAEMRYQIRMLQDLHKTRADRSPAALESLRRAALGNENVFETLMDAAKCCSLGQITGALFEAGGRYRRSL
ncbi:MAG: cobalamin B12-binding domain-containing protein [Elusimicrobia bacterium]|nr:cobalamin B12-binding domain-containing protein [Elusimicrobiota bacterium]